MMNERHNWSQVRGERGVSLITVMMVLFIMTLMGISILAITGFERQIASSVSSNEASTDAAESCVSTGANVLQQSLQAHAVPAALLSNAVPPGPVPFTNLAVLNGEMITDGGNPDFPIGAGSVPNLAMTVGNYQVFGDIDRLYLKCEEAIVIDDGSGAAAARYLLSNHLRGAKPGYGDHQSSRGVVRLPQYRLVLSAEALLDLRPLDEEEHHEGRRSHQGKKKGRHRGSQMSGYRQLLMRAGITVLAVTSLSVMTVGAHAGRGPAPSHDDDRLSKRRDHRHL